ncbi:hypothetical protein BAUCODRAFT_144893 [Baudoinia panamericana UAMH 10762]|uniref:DUF3431 domain containing protein n=1 Tax=Baudoinia panamericana (strain UAMH 10762) TaxID=717646 RepID=M2NK20_BAUPA|nr:uncharacterized protein BAUCODRAFT_144893 [Baudoinia panamericana UAMH 10762]EMC99475.1 hypothetical protein BAUCODRAFT_144893 [Baudoinia panamericana UAMH 10762]
MAVSFFCNPAFHGSRKIVSQLSVPFLCLLGLWLVYRRLHELGLPSYRITYTSLEINLPKTPSAKQLPGPLADTVVIGKLSSQDTTWTKELAPKWQAAVYTVNDTSAPLHTAYNKGREANAYLTYIIDAYHDLPETIAFVHSHRQGYPAAWHTEGLNHDIVKTLTYLNTTHVQAEGYVNLRCLHDPGCSRDGRIEPFRHVGEPQPMERDSLAEVAWLEAWRGLFPGQPIPFEIAAPCCAQFAVSRDEVRKRPLADYERFHRWLMHTTLSDDISGRIMEYAWHIIFGRDLVHCPPPQRCFDLLYGSKLYH